MIIFNSQNYSRTARLLGLALITPIFPITNHAQPFVPQFQIAPGWTNLPGLNLRGITLGAVAGQQLGNGLPIAVGGILDADSSDGSLIYVAPLPGAPQGNDFFSVSRFENRFLFGGHTNGAAITYSQTGIFGSMPLFRSLHPAGFSSSVVEGVDIETNDFGNLETAVGTVVNFLQPQAAWWENGVFHLLPNVPGGVSQAHGISSYQTIYNGEATNVPAYVIAGEYGTNFTQARACLWVRQGLDPETYVQLSIHPPGFAASRAFGVGNAYFDNTNSPLNKWTVGEGYALNNSSPPHAIIWDWSREFHDVHPAGFESSSARSTALNRSVGFATTNGQTHAMLWLGFTPVDLHGYFPDAVNSEATSISPDGRIAGTYRNAVNDLIPFVLIPQPSSSAPAANIGGATLVTTNDLAAFGLANLRMTSAQVNDSGVTSFLANEYLLPFSSVIFSRAPGGPLAPRFATGQPLDGSLVTGFYGYALDASNQIHAIAFLTGNNGGVEAVVKPDNSTQVFTRAGDLLPDGAVISTLFGAVPAPDGGVVVQGAATDSYEFLLLRRGITRTLILRTEAGYPSGTNMPNNLYWFDVGGISTNGQVLFTASHYVFLSPTVHFNGGRSIYCWSNNVLNEVLPLGGVVNGNLRLTLAQRCLMNERGDMAFIGSVTNSNGEGYFGLWRRLASAPTWETLAIEGGVSPGGVINRVDVNNFTMNRAASVLFRTVVEGVSVHLIARTNAPLEILRGGEDKHGILDISSGSLNRHEESVTIPSDDLANTPEVEFFCPRPAITNTQAASAGIAFDVQVPLTNRPYAVFSSTNLTGAFSSWSPTFTAPNSLTHFQNLNPSGSNRQRFFRAVRIP